ncbi:MAG: Methanogenesis regulatory protein FilR1 [Candidatus Methanogaster sp.]|nr:MAG: Methanogenesis regulatory protein FilR1 [ANME-2 cluster archaeon]
MQIKVLLIEDNPGDARLIWEMLLEVSGMLFDVETACRLSDGLTRIRKGGIDVVLLDLGLPDSAGLDTFKKVYDLVPEVPIVMLTGLDDTKLALEGMRMGAQDYLVKGRADSDLLARTLRYAIERKAAEAHIEHLNSVLKAIRNVNQLIVTDMGRDSLFRKSCDALVDARGYDAVWLGFLGDDGTFDLVVGSGFRDDIKHFSDRVAGGDYPPCIRDALREGGKVLVPDKPGACTGCFFKDVYHGKEALIVRVEHADRFFGLLAVLLAPGVAVDEEEKGLLAEVASDIGIALHNSEIAEARKVAEDALLESERKYSEFFRTSRDPVFIISEDGRLVESNDALAEVLGYETPDELLNIVLPEHYENPDDKKRFSRIIEQQGFIKEFPVNLRKKYGGIINILITATLLKDRDGNVTGIQGTIRDITDHKAAADALLESRGAVQAPVFYGQVDV